MNPPRPRRWASVVLVAALGLVGAACTSAPGSAVHDPYVSTSPPKLAGGPSDERLKLLHGSLGYRDARWEGVDAAALVEVIEHLEPERLPALEKVVFGAARPATVVVTTPNAEYNALFPNMAAGAFRHPDHRFEWTRAQFEGWASGVAKAHGYEVAFGNIGSIDVTHGAPTQMGIFTKASAA